MSLPIMIPWEERDRARPWRLRLTTRLAIGLATVLVRLPPHRLRRALQGIRRGARPATRAEAAAALRSVLSASLPMHGIRACLPRSVSAAVLCRLQGRWATWCAGVDAAPPMSAHAWIEVDGRPVDELDADGSWVRLLTVPPAGRPAGPGAEPATP